MKVLNLALLVLVYCALHGCNEKQERPVIPLCYAEPFNSWCVEVEFATLDDGMVVGRANDLDNRAVGVQYDIRMRMSRAMLGGYMVLTDNGYAESSRSIYTNDTNIVGFASYTLTMGLNELTAELFTGDGILIDKVIITVYVE